MNMTKPYVDMLGQEVNVGDHVIYATTSGRSPVQKFAIVEKIIWTQEEQPVWTKNRANLVTKVVDVVKVGVREISNSRGFLRWSVFKDPNKKARVTYPLVENIVKVNKPNES